MSKIKFIVGIGLFWLISLPVFAEIELQKNTIIQFFNESGAPLKSRIGSKYYRKLSEIKNECFLIQDFYSENNSKQIDPICLTNVKELYLWDPKSFHGTLVFWTASGTKIREEHWYKGKQQNAYTPTQHNSKGTFRPRKMTNVEYGSTKAKNCSCNNNQREKQQGRWTYWHKNGEKWSEGSYINGKQNGYWLYWHKNGKKRSEGNYINGKRNGHWVFWHDNGNISSQGNYQ